MNDQRILPLSSLFRCHCNTIVDFTTHSLFVRYPQATIRSETHKGPSMCAAVTGLGLRMHGTESSLRSE